VEDDEFVRPAPAGQAEVSRRGCGDRGSCWCGETASQLTRTAWHLVPRWMQSHDREDVVQCVMLRLLRRMNASESRLERLLPMAVCWEVLAFLRRTRVDGLILMAVLPDIEWLAVERPPEVDLSPWLSGLGIADQRVLRAVADGARGLVELGREACLRPQRVQRSLQRILRAIG
jgi:hypothetical protein